MSVKCDAAPHLPRICYSAVKLRPLLLRAAADPDGHNLRPRVRFASRSGLASGLAVSPVVHAGSDLTIGAPQVGLARSSIVDISIVLRRFVRARVLCRSSANQTDTQLTSDM